MMRDEEIGEEMMRDDERGEEMVVVTAGTVREKRW
jgi:hypothetical protein